MLNFGMFGIFRVFSTCLIDNWPSKTFKAFGLKDIVEFSLQCESWVYVCAILIEAGCSGYWRAVPHFDTSPSAEQRAVSGDTFAHFVRGCRSEFISCISDMAEVEVAYGPVQREGGLELFPFQNAQGPVMSVWLSQQRGCLQSADISTRGVSDPEDKYRSKDQIRNHQKS